MTASGDDAAVLCAAAPAAFILAGRLTPRGVAFPCLAAAPTRVCPLVNASPEHAAKKPRRKTLSFAEAFRSDFPASIIVFLVALPLCMGIAIASGAPPATGLITGIVGGIVVGLIAGSPLQVSGPAAGLFVLVAEVIADFSVGDTKEPDLERGLAAMGLAVLGAGVIQLAAGLLRLGNFFRAVSPAVIQGMLSGIGVLILASQFHVMVDDKNAAKPYLDAGYTKGVANLVTMPQSVLKAVHPFGSLHFFAAAIGVGTVLVLIFWKLIPKNPLAFIPAPVVAVTLASVVALMLGITLPPDELVAMEDDKQMPAEERVKITQVIVPDNLASAIRTPTDWGQTKELLSPALLLAAVTIALVASAETMLCATAVDQMQTHARTNYDRELTAQGVGNLICGFLGALPMTGVIVRSSANVDAGGRTRLSTILHGVWLLLLVCALPWLLNYIPMASLAAVLVFTGWKLINFKAIYKLWRVNAAEGVICLVTLALVVGVDLLTGVLVGIGCTAARLLYTFARLDVRVEDHAEANRVELHLKGAATFLALPKLTAVLDEVDPETELHVHLDRLRYVDHACLELFVNWEKQHSASGGRLVMDWDDLTATFKDAGAGAYDKTAAKDQPKAAAPAESP
ncbi:MAG: SulP family inorganic anion transporter [Planctomycetota bacterium]